MYIYIIDERWDTEECRIIEEDEGTEQKMWRRNEQKKNPTELKRE